MIRPLCVVAAVLGGIVYAAMEAPLLAGTALWVLYACLSVGCLCTVLSSRDRVHHAHPATGEVWPSDSASGRYIRQGPL